MTFEVVRRMGEEDYVSVTIRSCNMQNKPNCLKKIAGFLQLIFEDYSVVLKVRCFEQSYGEKINTQMGRVRTPNSGGDKRV